MRKDHSYPLSKSDARDDARASAKGQAILDGMDMYDAKVDPVTIKRRIGMVFQKPNPFPTMSIYDNVAARS